MILCDREIELLCFDDEPMVDPLNTDKLQPASLDICLGHSAKLLIEDPSLTKCTYKDIDLTKYTKENPYLFKPGQRLLVSSLESFNIPPNVCGIIKMKSSAGGKYIDCINSGFIDPGFNNATLTIQLINQSFCDFPIYPGLSIVQVIFYWLGQTPKRNYGEIGSYNGIKQVRESVR